MKAKIRKVADSLGSQFLERNDEIMACLLALLARKHVFLLGPPGTAKSLLVEALCRSFGGNYFRKLVTKFTTPEELFGPYSLTALKQDRFERTVDGYLPDVEIGFLDEIWKASSSIINTLLTLMEERIYHNGNTVLNAPLVSLFGASNELPEEDGLFAAYDRFLVRLNVKSITDSNNFRKLLTLTKPQISEAITAEELAAAQSAVSKIKLPPGTLDAAVQLHTSFEIEGFHLSDRRWHDAMDIARAAAYVAGRTEVEPEDLIALKNVLWDNPTDAGKVERLIFSVVAPSETKLLELLDAAVIAHREALESRSDEAAGIRAHSALKELLNQVNALPSSPRKLEIRDRVANLRGEVIEQCLGISV